MTAYPAIEAFFDEATFTVTYLVSDPATRRAAIVDPVLDYDHRAGKIATRSLRYEPTHSSFPICIVTVPAPNSGVLDFA